MPRNVRLSTNFPDCNGLPLQAVCDRALASDGELLRWDFDTTDLPVDGYYVYTSDSVAGTRALVSSALLATNPNPESTFAVLFSPKRTQKLGGCFVVVPFKSGKKLGSSAAVCGTAPETVKFPVPTNLQLATSPTDCAAHASGDASYIAYCKAALSNGHLVMMWDFDRHAIPVVQYGIYAAGDVGTGIGMPLSTTGGPRTVTRISDFTDCYVVIPMLGSGLLRPSAPFCTK